MAELEESAGALGAALSAPFEVIRSFYLSCICLFPLFYFVLAILILLPDTLSLQLTSDTRTMEHPLKLLDLIIGSTSLLSLFYCYLMH